MKNCPFCNEPMPDNPEIYDGGSGPPPKVAVICDGCGAQGPDGYGMGRGDYSGATESAKKKWDVRYQDGFNGAASGWISTKDQLPQEGQEVTVRMMHGQIRQAVKDKGYAGGWRQPNCAGWEIVTCHADSITHWRPEIFERPSKDHY